MTFVMGSGLPLERSKNALKGTKRGAAFDVVGENKPDSGPTSQTSGRYETLEPTPCGKGVPKAHEAIGPADDPGLGYPGRGR